MYIKKENTLSPKRATKKTIKKKKKEVYRFKKSINFTFNRL